MAAYRRMDDLKGAAPDPMLGNKCEKTLPYLTEKRTRFLLSTVDGKGNAVFMVMYLLLENLSKMV